ncbi:MAG: hypothetical protein ACI8ZB_005064 [Desulforhopalus sp.]|jgi:hypothetical protein
MIRWFTILLMFLVGSVSSVLAEDIGGWPRDVKVDSGTITVYQPQVDSLKGDTLTGRAAVAFHAKAGGEPVFGATWFTGKVNIDRDERTVTYRSLEMTEVRFPEGSEQAGIELTEVIKKSFESWNLTSSLDSLMTSLAASDSEAEAASELKNNPPAIVYRDHPALLVTIDGKEQLQTIENTHYESVMNTPYPLVRNTEDGAFHLNAAEGVWYISKSVDGPWTYNTDPLLDLVAMVEQRKEGDSSATDGSTDGDVKITFDNAPEIVVVHEPTELVVSEGKAAFAPLTGDLLAMSNTDTSVFMDVKEQKYYMVISGRWYQAPSMEATWSYIESDGLPLSFAEIPDDSQYADVKAYVAGTDEAREAIVDAQIPQTAAVKRENVDIKVIYDGTPKFEKVDGTSLQFAVNCSETIIKADSSYYLVKEAVWYLSMAPEGPWEVSDHAPPGIDGTKPSSPVYNTKYVYVYDSTPEVVYVGYTPGYMCSYVYGPTIVYGTGWYYRPWITPHYYYPRHATWGFSVNYNPWSGWGFGLSWNSGPFHFGFYTGGGWHRRPWYGPRLYGPGGYRPGIHNYRRGNVNIGNTININRNRNFSGNNLYRNNNHLANIKNTTNVKNIDRSKVSNKMANINKGSVNKANLQNKAANIKQNGRANNVFTDKKGNIYRNDKGNWQEHKSGKWNNVKEMSPDRQLPSSAGSKVSKEAAGRVKQTTAGSSKVSAPRASASKDHVTKARPATRPTTSSRPSSSGYSRPSSVQRQSHARARSGGGGARR